MRRVAAVLALACAAATAQAQQSVPPVKGPELVGSEQPAPAAPAAPAATAAPTAKIGRASCRERV